MPSFRFVFSQTVTTGTFSHELEFTPNERYLFLSAEERARLSGNTFFLEIVAASIGRIVDFIKAVGSKQFAAELLTLAFFSIISLECYTHVASYQAFHKFPCDRLQKSWEVIRIAKVISEQHCQDFFSLRLKRTDESQWISIDSINYSGYGTNTA